MPDKVRDQQRNFLKDTIESESRGDDEQLQDSDNSTVQKTRWIASET